MSKTKSDKPFCKDCPNAYESQSFSTEDVIMELNWALDHVKKGIKDMETYLKERISEIKSDEEDARICENCNRNEKEEIKQKVEFT